MIEPVVTVAMLRSAHVSPVLIARFSEIHPSGSMVVTRESVAHAAALNFVFDWLGAKLLRERFRGQLDAATAQPHKAWAADTAGPHKVWLVAQGEADKAREAALAGPRKVWLVARAEADKAREAALAGPRKAREVARAEADKARKVARAEADKAWEADTAEARKVWDVAQAEAFADAFIAQCAEDEGDAA